MFKFFSSYFAYMRPSFLGSLIGGALGLVGSVIGADAQESSAESANQTNIEMMRETNRFNKEEAELNRNWQTGANLQAMEFSAAQAAEQREFTERLSNTSYQRAVADMKRAGINPMLAVTQGGASTPSVGSPSGVSSAGSAASGVTTRVAPELTFNKFGQAIQAASSAVDVMQRAEQVENVAAQTRNIDADTANKLLLPADIQAGTNLKGSMAYEATTRGHVNQLQETKLQKTIDPIVESIRASADQSRASAEQTRSQNLAIKDLMENPATRDFAPLLQLFLAR